MRSRVLPRAVALFVVFIVLVALAVIGAGCATKETTGATTGAQSAPEPTSTESTTTPSTEGSKTVPTATVKTNKGTFVITFLPEKAPKHVESFVKLSKDGFYNGNKVHRYEPNFVIQMGDPQTNSMTSEDVIAKKNPRIGTGGPGYNIPAEFNDEPHVPGTIAMARSQDPNSAGSQFYIVIGPASFLDGQYTVFGKVTDGYDEVASKLRVGDEIESITINDAQ